MIIDEIRKTEETGGIQTLSAVVTYETPTPRSFRLFFKVHGAPGDISATADPFLIEFLLPAMLLGEDLRITGPIDPELLATIQGNVIPLLRQWFPFLNEVNLKCDCLRTPPSRVTEGDAALAFSGGLDATYTAARNLSRIDWLVITQGLDVRSYQHDYWQKTLIHIRAVAEALDKPVIVVNTNVREVSHYQAIRTRRGRIDPRYYQLGRMGALGTCLSSIGRLVAPFCSRFFISAGVAYNELQPYGTHPLLDPMWSTSQQQVLHYGCEAGRIEKIAWLKKACPAALGRIRVCWLPLSQDVNCSRCEKCLRTMAEIRLCGGEASAGSFRWPLDFALIRKLNAGGRSRVYWINIRNRALSIGDAELARAAQAAIGYGPSSVWRAFRQRQEDHHRARHTWKRLRRLLNPPASESGAVPVSSRTMALLSMGEIASEDSPAGTVAGKTIQP